MTRDVLRRLSAALGAVIAAGALAACAPVSASGAEATPKSLRTLAATDPKLRRVGLWEERSDGALRTVTAGVQLRARFTGRRAVLTFRDAGARNVPRVWVHVDDVLWRSYDATGVVDVSAALVADRDEHDIRVVVQSLPRGTGRWSTGDAGAVELRSLAVEKAAQVRDTPGPALRMTVFGDSVTEGRGPRAADARSSYAFLAAEALRAELTQVGYAGQGVLQVGGDGVPAAGSSLGLVRAGVPAAPATPPDVVVVNFGANDRSSPTEFQQAYADYLAQLRQRFPTAALVALPPLNAARSLDIAFAVRRRQVLGDGLLTYLPTAGWLPPDSFLDGVHPTAAGHARAGERLASALRGIAAQR